MAKKITIDKIEKIIEKKYTDFSQIVFAIKIREGEYPHGYTFAYMFENQVEYFWQLQSNPTANDGKVISTKKQFNQRIDYIYKNGWEFEEVLVDEGFYDTLLIKFTKEEFKK